LPPPPLLPLLLLILLMRPPNTDPNPDPEPEVEPDDVGVVGVVEVGDVGGAAVALVPVSASASAAAPPSGDGVEATVAALDAPLLLRRLEFTDLSRAIVLLDPTFGTVVDEAAGKELAVAVAVPPPPPPSLDAAPAAVSLVLGGIARLWLWARAGARAGSGM